MISLFTSFSYIMIRCPSNVFDSRVVKAKFVLPLAHHSPVFELNFNRKPNLPHRSLYRIGKAEYHLGGPTCNPLINRLLAGFDPVAVDAAVAALLGFDWREIEHLRLADGVLGTAQ